MTIYMIALVQQGFGIDDELLIDAGYFSDVQSAQIKATELKLQEQERQRLKAHASWQQQLNQNLAMWEEWHELEATGVAHDVNKPDVITGLKEMWIAAFSQEASQFHVVAVQSGEMM